MLEQSEEIRLQRDAFLLPIAYTLRKIQLEGTIWPFKYFLIEGYASGMQKNNLLVSVLHLASKKANFENNGSHLDCHKRQINHSIYVLI